MNTSQKEHSRDAEVWAQQERLRRKAWLEGPSEMEKNIWAFEQARQKARRMGCRVGDYGTIPSPEELEEWARNERERREAWINGPTPAEKEAWVREDSCAR